MNTTDALSLGMLALATLRHPDATSDEDFDHMDERGEEAAGVLAGLREAITEHPLREGAQSTCVDCGQVITWSFDTEEVDGTEVTSTEHGWWYSDVANEVSVCGGKEDGWHRPVGAVEDNGPVLTIGARAAVETRPESEVEEHIAAICAQADLPVLAPILGIVLDREEVTEEQMLALDAADVMGFYDFFVGRAVDGIETDILNDTEENNQ